MKSSLLVSLLAIVTTGSLFAAPININSAGENISVGEDVGESSIIPVQIVVQTQPSTNATAGILFSQQPVVTLVDTNGNLAVEDSTTQVTVSAGSATLQGALTATAVNGVVSFSDLFSEIAETISLTFSASGLTDATSDPIEVVPAAATTLVFSTSPSEALTGSPFGVQPVVITTDDFGNASTSGLATSQIVAISLTAGTGALMGTTTADIGTDFGNGTVQFTDLQIDVAGTGKELTVTNESLLFATSETFFVGGVVPADAIVSVDTAMSGSVELDGPIYFESASGDIGTGTIILNAPAGFEFMTTGQTPRVQIHRISGPNGGGINGINIGAPQDVNSVTSTQITYNIDSSSFNGTVNSITWSKIRVRATSGTEASGHITKTGTAVMPVVTEGVTTFGFLQTTVGEIAELTIQTQPSAVANAGINFAQQPVIEIRDQFENLLTNDNSTVVTAIANGSGSLQGTTSVTATNGLVIFTDLSYNTSETITITFTNDVAAVISDEVVVGAGAVAGLVFTVEPVDGVVGLPFPVSPVVQTVDQFGNPSAVNLPANLDVTLTLTSGSGPLTGTTTLDIGTAGGNGTVTFDGLQIDSASVSNEMTASAVDLKNAVSGLFATVAADHLEYVEGDGQTAVAGNAVAINPTVRVVDADTNAIVGATVTFVVQSGGGSVSEATVISDANGLASTIFTLGGDLGESNQILTASSSVAGSPDTITFYATATIGTAARLGFATHPSATATAGETFVSQPVIRIEDSFGNLITDDNTTEVTAAINTGSGALNGVLTVTAVGGIATFTDLSYNVAEVIDLVFTASTGLTNVVSETITVSPAIISALAFTTEPGNAYSNHDLDPQPVVKSQDEFGNDSTNGLPENLIVSVALTSGTGELLGTTNIDVGTAGSVGVAAFSDLQVTTGGIDKQLTATATNLANAVSALFTNGGVDPGITAIIPADGSSIPMSGPAYYELYNADVSAGTITLDAPAGFEFDTAFAPVVRVQRIGGTGNPSNNINGASNGEGGTTYPVTISPTQITFTVNNSSVNGATSSLTWENIHVRSAGAGAASGEVIKSGESVMATVVNGMTSFATLNGEPQPTKIVIVSEPSTNATAGVQFAQQPVVRVEDQYGNVWANDSVTVTAARAAGSGDLQGTVIVQTVDGIATFTDLSHNVAGTITLTFSGVDLASATSGNIAISPAAADHMHFTTQPGSAVMGASFGVQPVVKSYDQFENLSSVGLGATHIVTVVLYSGTGSLTGTTSVDIGTVAGNGTGAFTDLGASDVGDKQLIASASGLTSEVSDAFTVSGPPQPQDQTITFLPLAPKTFGDAPFEVNATSSSGLTVTFIVVSGPANITSGNLVTLTGIGTVKIRASQAGNENFNPAPDVEQSFVVSPSSQAVKGDINGDLKADILFQDGQVIGVWYMDGVDFTSGAFLREGTRVNANWRLFGQADFTGDGNNDLVFQHFDGRLAIWEMNGDEKVSAQLLDGGTPLGEGWRAVTVADCDGDQSPDIVIQNVNGSVSILFMDGTNFDSISPLRGTEALGWRVRAAGDLDGDSVSDILLQHLDGRITMWKGGDFATEVVLNNGNPVGWRVVGLGDFNGDDELDLLFRSVDNRLAVWLMDGTERSSALVLRDGRTVDSKWSVVGPR